LKIHTKPRFATGTVILATGLLLGSGLAARPVGQAASAPRTEAASTPPPGPALALITDHCSACHATSIIFGQRKTPDDWAATVQLMVDRGAELKPEETDMVVDYLTKNFPAPEPSRPAAP
jgi:mono/diheme cytochrome c family protein